jgi:pimeloyl-ACP methyl ester carboxylesterase
MKLLSSFPVNFLSVTDGSKLAYLHLEGSSPGVMFCAGFQSSMRGRKAEALFQWCQAVNCEFTCFDYFGHGQSINPPQYSQDETWHHATLGRWLQDTIAVLDTVTLTRNKQILVGSSMGAWLAILVAQMRTDRVAGLIGVASAPDAFQLLEERIYDSPHLRQSMMNMGYCDMPSAYSNSGFYRIHQHLLQESRSHYILSKPNIKIDISCPVCLIHGKQDEDVSWTRSQILYDRLSAPEKKLIYIEDGDHRLSRDEDLNVLVTQLKEII